MTKNKNNTQSHVKSVHENICICEAIQPLLALSTIFEFKMKSLKFTHTSVAFKRVNVDYFLAWDR